MYSMACVAEYQNNWQFYKYEWWHLGEEEEWYDQPNEKNAQVTLSLNSKQNNSSSPRVGPITYLGDMWKIADWLLFDRKYTQQNSKSVDDALVLDGGEEVGDCVNKFTSTMNVCIVYTLLYRNTTL